MATKTSAKSPSKAKTSAAVSSAATKTASARTKQSSKPASSRQFTYEEIARVAYQLYQQRGGQHGNDVNDWVEAERLLRARG